MNHQKAPITVNINADKLQSKSLTLVQPHTNVKVFSLTNPQILLPHTCRVSNIIKKA